MSITFPIQSNEKPHSCANTYEIPPQWNVSECKPILLETSQGELATMICLSLLQPLVQTREREKNRGLSSNVFSEQMQHVKGGGLLSPQRKTFSRWWKHDWATWVARPNFWSTVTAITLGALWHPTLVKKSPGEREEAQTSTKGTFWGRGDATWESWAPCPSLGSVVKGYKGPQSETLWDFDVAKSECNIALPSIRERTRKSSHICTHTCREISTKLQHKGHIHCYTKPERRDGIGLNGVYYVALMPQGLRRRWKSGPCLTFQEKGHTTMTLERKYSCLCLNLSFWLTRYPLGIAKWIKDT